VQTIQRILRRPRALVRTNRIRRGRRVWRLPVIVLTLLQVLACSGVFPGDEALEHEAPATERMELVGRTPDVVLDLAESTSGWKSGSAVTLSSERKQGKSSLYTNGDGGFRRTNLPPVDVRNMKYLTFWYYINDPSKIRTDRDAQIEISSHTSVDTEEMNWNLHSQQLRSGWNFVRVQLPGKLRSTTANNINLAAVKRFRIYHFVSSAVITAIDDIRFSNRESLEFAAGCANATASRTATGGDKFNKVSGYSATGCSDSYVVDLNEYDFAHTHGTTLAYADTLPTTKAACEDTFLTVGVWECLPGSTSSSCAPSVAGSARAFLGEVVARGVWLRNPLDQGICRRPRITLERHIPEFQADRRRDFKIAVRAQTTGVTRRAVSFATTKRRESAIYLWDELRDGINAVAAGAIHPSVHELWLKKGTSTGNLLCRSSQLDHTLMTFSARSLRQLGASSANVTAKNNAYAGMRNALCTPSGTEAALQTSTRDFFSALINIRGELTNLHFSTASSLGGSFSNYDEYSVMLMAESMRHDLGLLVSNCNPSVPDLYRFESTGVLPAGVPADRALLGTCGSNSASTVASNLGVGGLLTGGDARTRLADCLAPAEQDVCNDPRSAPGIPQENPEGLGAGGPCFNEAGGSVPCTPDETEDRDAVHFIVVVADENAEAIAAEELERYMQENPDANVPEVIIISEQSQEPAPVTRIEFDKPFSEETPEGRLGNALKKDADSQLERIPFYHTTTQIIEEIVNSVLDPKGPTEPNTVDPPWCSLNGTCFGEAAWPCPGAPGEEPRDNCPPEDGTAGGSSVEEQQYCPPDWAPGGWYGASNSQYGNGQPPREIAQSDRIEHCFCEALDPGYVATGTPSARASAMCPSKREQVAHYCLAAQWGPDDPIPPECLGELEPAHVDDQEWMHRICQQIRCPENQYAVPDGDRCHCIALTTDVVGDPRAEICRLRGWAAHCEEGTDDCVCGGQGYGDSPYNDPTCENDPTTFPGSLERISTPTPERLVVFADPRTPDDLFLGMIDNSTTSNQPISALLPAFDRSTLPAIGTGVSTRLLTTEAASSGVFQLFLHNPETGVFHEYADQCEIRTLTAGQPAVCDLTPDNSQRRAKWNDCFRSGPCAFELTLQGTPPAFNGIVGFTAPVFNGTLQPTTAPRLPECPRPTPDIFIRDLHPLWRDLGGTPVAPNVDLTLGSGGVVRLPPTTFTVNPDQFRFVNPG
jgi:hypothetical protein